MSKGLPGAEIAETGYDVNERLSKAGSTAYKYDSANNPTEIGGVTNMFNAANQLTEETGGAKYGYDEQGERTATPSSAGQPPLFDLAFGGSGSGAGQLEKPAGVATDSSGNVWVADTGHDRVQEFNAKGEFVREFGAAGSEHGAFKEPRGIAVSAAGNVYVADDGNSRVQEFNSKGEFVRAFGSWGAGEGEFAELRDVAVDGEGHVWTIDSGGQVIEGSEVVEVPPRVQEFSAEGVYIGRFGAEGTGNGQFKEPKGIAVDSKGNVWVADTGNNRVQEFKPTGEFVRAFGSEGSGNGQFSKPTGVAVDSEGDPWVVDPGNNRVQRFTSEGSYLSQVGKAGNNNGQFAKPEGIASGGSGNVWVADTGNNRVQEWSPAPTMTATYDQAGNLTDVTRANVGETPAIKDTYTFTGDGLRASQTVSGTTSYITWDESAGQPLVLGDGTNNYIYGPGGVPIEQINSEKPQYLHPDQAGSTRLITGGTGAVEGAYAYTPYGAVEGHTGTATTPLGYDGQYTSSDSGLIYLRARAYDPNTAQFMSVDPMLPVTGEPYTYANDNPLTFSDPSGLLFGIKLPSIEEVGEDLEEVGTRYVGFVDGFTSPVFGGTAALRGALGLNGGLETCSLEYQIAYGIGKLDMSLEAGAALGGATEVGVDGLLAGVRVGALKIGPIVSPLAGGIAGGVAQSYAAGKTPSWQTVGKGALGGFAGEMATGFASGTSASGISGAVNTAFGAVW